MIIGFSGALSRAVHRIFPEEPYGENQIKHKLNCFTLKDTHEPSERLTGLGMIPIQDERQLITTWASKCPSGRPTLRQFVNFNSMTGTLAN